MALGRLLCTLLGIGFLPLAYASTESPEPLDAKQLHVAHVKERAFIQEMAQQHHFKKSALTQLLQKAPYNGDVIAKVTHPFEKKPRDFYQQHFVTEKRVHDGAHYWNHHQQTLYFANQHYRVDPSVVIAIIGVESAYGNNMGGYNELSTLKTLAFYYPPREKFFRKELGSFLRLAQHNQLPILAIKGSYAGALGIPQFMPSSYQHYGVTYNRRPHANLISSHGDAIASVANYLKAEGWQWGEPVAVPAVIHGFVPRRLLSNSAKPQYTLAQLARHGVHTKQKIAYKGKVALIELQKTRGKEYWIAFPNFRAIMQYNPSTSYAMGVYQLSQAIEKHHATIDHQPHAKHA